MFRLMSPCSDCPFRRGNGQRFQLRRGRLIQAIVGSAFQCHKTLVVGDDDLEAGEAPQQCAGLMRLLTATDRPNQIMQIASRLGALAPEALDPRRAAYESLDETFTAHGHRPPTEEELRAAERDLLRGSHCFHGRPPKED